MNYSIADEITKLPTRWRLRCNLFSRRKICKETHCFSRSLLICPKYLHSCLYKRRDGQRWRREEISKDENYDASSHFQDVFLFCRLRMSL